MAKTKISAFEIVLLVVGVAVAILGFNLINQVYNTEIEISWLMLIAIFSWLMLLVIFIALSVVVDVSKKHLAETKKIVDLLGQKKGKKMWSKSPFLQNYFLISSNILFPIILLSAKFKCLVFLFLSTIYTSFVSVPKPLSFLPTSFATTISALALFNKS